MKQDGQSLIELAPAEARWVALAVRVPPEVAAQAGTGSHAITFEVSRLSDEARQVQHQLVEKSTFMVPR